MPSDADAENIALWMPVAVASKGDSDVEHAQYISLCIGEAFEHLITREDKSVAPSVRTGALWCGGVWGWGCSGVVVFGGGGVVAWWCLGVVVCIVVFGGGCVHGGVWGWLCAWWFWWFACGFN